MKTAGLIGGVAWPSTLLYYRLLNEYVQCALGGLHSAPCVISSLDFAPIYAEMAAGDRASVTRRMEDAALQVRAAGAEVVAILSNTGHFAADEVAAAAGVPLVHLVRETAASIRAALPGLRRIGLLATGFTVEAPFFGRWLTEHAGYELVLPDASQQRMLDAAIFGPLARGEPTRETVEGIDALCASLQSIGAEAVLLGCTELSPIAARLSCDCPVFDSTDIHARAIVRAMTLPQSPAYP
jgi:aspartate racemase